MEQSFEASFDDNWPGINCSEEMLSLMRRIHSMMQAREEREASTPQSSSGPAHPAVVSQPTNNIPEPPHPIFGQPARAPDPPNNAFPAPTLNIPVGSLASILDSLHEAISDFTSPECNEGSSLWPVLRGKFFPIRVDLAQIWKNRFPIFRNVKALGM
ncbi:hypothetical protein BDP27DRAFT_1431571 [Rhodocollybia butyracea]|uniref:Uncharacterized protein n=1 Tax=Rhodocollybia butyracea TaxID=206335 RepID=A0A9P5TXZ8_9AGAR|nr:hypothetical protein BDP27DRAFT_1431571 [Rhodocollybia butyracea]